MAQRQFCRYQSQWISCRFGSKGGTSAQAGIDFYETVVSTVRGKRKLYVALTDDSELPDNTKCDIPEGVILGVGECLAWRDDNALTGVNAHGIEILHVAHS